jgi:hypothetical protein
MGQTQTRVSSSDSAVDVSSNFDGVYDGPAPDKGPEKKYDLTLTDKVIAATGPNALPRLAQIMPSLIRHLHEFAREVDLTVDEWTAGVELVSMTNSPPRLFDSPTTSPVCRSSSCLALLT